MKEFNIVEKVGISYISYSDAVKQAIQTINKQVYWFEVIEQRGESQKMTKSNFKLSLK